MAQITLIEAVTLAMKRAMEEDASVVVLGEDVGVNGGVFRATAGLQQSFGDERVIDTPLAEVMIAGVTVGMASQGMKPVAEAQFCGFSMPMIDHLMCHAGRLRNRTRGRLSCPMVLRFPSGGGIHAPEHHSESPEALFAHMPGIRVVIPSSPSRAYGLLLAAIRDPDPVVFMEPKRIYRWQREDVVDDGEELPLDVCFTLRDGKDLTLVTWGAMIKETLQAADQLENKASASKSSTWRLSARWTWIRSSNQSSAPGAASSSRKHRATAVWPVRLRPILPTPVFSVCWLPSSGYVATTRSCRCTGTK